MPKKCFYSFHFDADNWRASTIRQIGAIEGSQTVPDNDWEAVKRGGDAAIERWIAGQMKDCVCLILLVGTNTAGRKWIEYEIVKAWNDNKGVVGVHIHNLLDQGRLRSAKGANPLTAVSLKGDGTPLSSICKTYDPPYVGSADVYGHIRGNIEAWVEEAIAIRRRY